MSILSGAVYDYASMILPKIDGNFFEIGVFNGVGFARIAKENLSKICYAVDPFIEDGHTELSSGKRTGEQLVDQKTNFISNTADLTNVVLHETTSKQYLDQLTDSLAEQMNVGMVVIDGDHHYKNVVVDFAIAMRLIGNKSGQIVVDDTNVADVGQAYNEFLQQYQHRIEKDITAAGSTKVILIQGTE